MKVSRELRWLFSKHNSTDGNWVDVDVDDYVYDWIVPSVTKCGRLSGMSNSACISYPSLDDYEDKGTWLKTRRFLDTTKIDIASDDLENWCAYVRGSKQPHFTSIMGFNEGAVNPLSGVYLGVKDMRLYVSMNRHKQPQPVKLGKFIKRLFPDISSDGDAVRKKVEEFKADHFSKFRFSFLPSSEIPSIYSESVRENGSSLDNSCMQSVHSSEYFQLYVDNCEGILVARDMAGVLCGRALVWKAYIPAIDRSMLVLDRPYYDGLTDMDFIHYAKEQGMIYRGQAYSDLYYPDGNRVPVGDVVSVRDGFKVRCIALIRLSRNLWDYDAYPYVDSFNYVVDDTWTLCAGYECGYLLTRLTGTEGMDDEDYFY